MAWSEWDSWHKRWVVAEQFDPDEAEYVAHALGLEDSGAKELLEVAAEVRAMNESLKE